jgi:hypothetical protein
MPDGTAYISPARLLGDGNRPKARDWAPPRHLVCCTCTRRYREGPGHLEFRAFCPAARIPGTELLVLSESDQVRRGSARMRESEYKSSSAATTTRQVRAAGIRKCWPMAVSRSTVARVTVSRSTHRPDVGPGCLDRRASPPARPVWPLFPSWNSELGQQLRARRRSGAHAHL